MSNCNLQTKATWNTSFQIGPSSFLYANLEKCNDTYRYENHKNTGISTMNTWTVKPSALLIYASSFTCNFNKTELPYKPFFKLNSFITQI